MLWASEQNTSPTFQYIDFTAQWLILLHDSIRYDIPQVFCKNHPSMTQYSIPVMQPWVIEWMDVCLSRCLSSCCTNIFYGTCSQQIIPSSVVAATFLDVFDYVDLWINFLLIRSAGPFLISKFGMSLTQPQGALHIRTVAMRAVNQLSFPISW
jgi:hypothetical protein